MLPCALTRVTVAATADPQRSVMTSFGNNAATAATMADEHNDETAQTLPPALAEALPTHTRAVFHSSAATRVMLFGESHRAPTRLFHDFRFDVNHVGSIVNLLHSWSAVFMAIQTAMPTQSPLYNTAADPEAWAMFLLARAREYRAELEATLIEAARTLDDTSSPAAALSLRSELASLSIPEDEYKFHLLLLETCKSLLHLIEIVYLDPHMNLTAQLTDWIQRTLVKPQVVLSEEEAAQEEEERDAGGPERSPDVMRDRDADWSCVCHLVLQGRLYETLQMLSSCEDLTHPDSEHSAIMTRVMQAIETVPALAQQEAQSQSASSSSSSKNRNQAAAQPPLEQFQNECTAWKRGVRQLRADLARQAPHEHIDLLLAVLLGEDDAMLQCAASNYLELFLGHLLYVKPYMLNSKAELSSILEKCMRECEAAWRESRGLPVDDDATGAADEETLYTPIDTLRFHLISSDISSALSVMSSMIDLRFFMAHVVHLLGATGEVLHHAHDLEVSAAGGVALPKPLRLKHSALGDQVSLVEFHVVSYGESLEAAATDQEALAGQGGNDSLWTLAVEYYAAAPEIGRGFLVNLLRKQSLTGPSGSRKVDHRRVLKLLAIAQRFGLREEYNHILHMAGNLCVQSGVEALRIAAAAALAPPNRSAFRPEPLQDASGFGQATHWFSMLQPIGKVNNLPAAASIARAGVTAMERVAEVLLDQLLLAPQADPTVYRLAFQSCVGVLAHAPSALILPLDTLLVASGDVQLGSASGVLSFLAAFHAMRRSWFDFQRVARSLDAVKQQAAAASNNTRHTGEAATGMDLAGDGGEEEEGKAQSPASSSSAILARLLVQHASLHASTLASLLALLRHLPTLLPTRRQYWLPLLSQLVDLMDDRAPKLSPERRALRLQRRRWAEQAHNDRTESWFEQLQPVVVAPAVSGGAQAPLLPLDTITHVQRMLAVLLHSNSAALYSASVGGAAGVKQMQAALNAFTNHTIQRHA